MALRTARLPGVRFEVVPPRRADVLPRMDVALFAGFASSGPLHIPVAVEDAAQFEAVFGGDLPLAWDAASGEQLYAYLAPAVRAFFRNGGRRCWIVRLAGDHAHTACFPIPGLAQVAPAGGLSPAFAAARSPGSWADGLLVGSALLSQPVVATAFDPLAKTLDVELSAPGQVAAGDLLRLSYASQGYLAFFPVEAVVSLESGAGAPLVEAARRLRLAANEILWFRPAESQAPPSSSAELVIYDAQGEVARLAVEVPIAGSTSPPGESPPRPDWPLSAADLVRLDCLESLPEAATSALQPGALVQVIFAPDGGGAAQSFWMMVQEQSSSEVEPGSPPLSPPALSGAASLLRLAGQGLWLAPETPGWAAVTSPPGPLPDFAEKLLFELWARQGEQTPLHLGELGFAPQSPRYWNALPDDDQLYASQGSSAQGSFVFSGDQSAFGSQFGGTSVLSANPYAGLWAAAHTPRFPLAGGSTSQPVYIPLAMPTLPGPYASPLETPGTALERDGLETFSAGLFLDPDLADVGSEPLLDQADYLRYFSPEPRRLRGIHAALAVEEAAIIAVPDAVQRGWFRAAPLSQPLAGPSAPLERPEWWHFLPCSPPASFPLAAEPQWGRFLNCGLRIIPAPALQASEPDRYGSFTLTWTEIEGAAAYVLEESAFPDFSGAEAIYQGGETRLEVYGYDLGDYYYRVRALALRPDGDYDSSDWSLGAAVRIAPTSNWQVRPVDAYDGSTLRAVQRCLLRLCAARGDLFAVLALPGHYREEQTLEHARDLRSPLAGLIEVELPDLEAAAAGATRTVFVSALNYSEARSLSFGALYHPWLVGREESQTALHRNPPDGAAAGVLARRAFERGAWVAPANQPLRGVLALDPPLDRNRWLELQEGLVNLLRREPTGFVCLDADTLSDDPDWRPLNVRRLISLLRRLALRYGPTYVFEPNDDAFRRLVKATFESLLDQMFVRGAFAGATPETSYQVNVVTSPQDIDAGRFIVELRVAPSLPLRFLTVRLVQSGERSLVTEGG